MKPFRKSEIQIVVALSNETQGLFDDQQIPLHYCGIGKINAASKVTEVILKTNCKHVINLGTAGSHRFSSHSVIECKAFVQRDMDLSPLGIPLGQTPMDKLPSILSVPTYLEALKSGVCGTGDKFEVGPPKLDCDLVDMEAYAMAKVCRKFEVGFTSIKYITDGSDENAHKDWVNNLKPAAKKLLEIYLQLVEQSS